ncbi:hypothetical protein GCM10027445_53920 [Amycolatopsis endophytica]|uniref:Uncharacterized protein n=1 Tax=Amycolatopsis endophytica TaxID=860233 RepID=A0A853AVY7_9PSEU|nr:hypothetical protein [Amycolatopsis endophytica]NYI86818.1 hypothetical protein [Amycolatopsis endophytica]
MAATQHSRSGSRSQDGGRTAEIAAVERLLGQAAHFELRAPELALVLGERASALAEGAGAEELWVRAEGLAVSARVRLGLRAPTVGRAVAALRTAEDTGETVLAARLRTELAVCARSVGAPLTGLAALRPVLDAPGFAGAHKAAALSQLVGCLSQFGRKPELDRTLAEADRLCGADDDLDGDGRLLARGLLRVAVSAHRRRHGDVVGAADAARTGLGFLEQLEDPQHDGGVVRGRLVLQLVCSLLDRGDGANALELAQSVLDEPARAASVAPAGWLRMAIATRVLLPSGSVEAAARMLRDAVHATERHELHALTARLWTELSHVEERLGRFADAIECLHLARAAEHVHARARRQAVGLLAGEFGGGGHAEVDLDHVLGSVPASEGAASVAVAPLSVPEPKVPASREPGSPAKTTADAPQPRAAAEPDSRSESSHSAKPGWSLAPEPADERPAEAARAPRFAVPTALSAEQLDGARTSPVVSRADRVTESGTSRTDDAAGSAVSRARGATGSENRAEETSGSGTPQVERAVEPTASRGDRTTALETSRADGTSGSGASPVEPAVEPVVSRVDRVTGAGTPRAEIQEGSAAADLGESRADRRGETAISSRPEMAVSAPGAADVVDPREDAAASRSGSASEDEASGPEQVVAGSPSERVAGMAAGAGHRAEVASAAVSGQTADAVGAPGTETASPAEEVASREERSESRIASRKTRHDSEHGSVAARSVLDRLGISAGASGGRRRAADSGDPGRPESGGRRRADDDAAARQGTDGPGESWLSEDAEPVSRAEIAPAPQAETPEDKPRAEHEPAPSMPVVDNWLPRLRLPPSLAPWDDFADTGSDSGTSTSETPFTNAPVLQDDDLGEPFRSDPPGTPDDDLPEDAGLADLLARALAEHQAGTASAAALVKRLGNQSPAEPRPVNGHGRNGSEPGNGRHRGDG